MGKVWCMCLNVSVHLSENPVFLSRDGGGGGGGEREKAAEGERERAEAAKWFFVRTSGVRVGVGKLTVAGIQKVPILSSFSLLPLFFSPFFFAIF